MTNEIINRTSVNDGLFTKRRIRRTEWSGSASGVLVTNDNSERYSPFYLIQQSVRRSALMWQFEFTNLDGDIRTIEGEALIQNLPISGDVQSFVQCTVNIIGTGGFTLDETPSSPPTDENVDSDYWTTTSGQFQVSGLSVGGKTLQGKTILAIAREGTVYDPITTGSPSNRTALFNSALGRITFDSNIPFNPNETVWAMWKD
ncbi:MAG: hypothetical protein RLZZ184_3607, partial [Cyanobacteriota bacterium]